MNEVQDTPHYILCRPAAQPALYDHNPVVHMDPKVWVVKCVRYDLAEYQLGRLWSCIGWAVNNTIYSSKEDALESKDFIYASTGVFA